MYKDAETFWAIESAPLRKKKKEAPLCQKIVEFTVSLYLHEVNEKEKLKNQLWKLPSNPHAAV